MTDVIVVEHLSQDQVVKLHRMYQNEWFTEGRTLADITKMLAHTDFIFGFCDPDDDELVGFARVITDHVYKAFVFDLIVDKDYRRNGLGIFIMETLFNHPVLKVVSNIELYCPDHMVPYYEQMGFFRRSSLLLRRNAE